MAQAEGTEVPPRNISFPEETIEDITNIDTCVEFKEISFDQLTLYERCEEGGKEYVAGFIASKLGETFPELARKPSQYSSENALWIRLLSD